MPDISKIEDSLYELEDTITVPEAIQVLAESGIKVSGTTIRTWCERYGIGKKMGGRYRIDINKLSLLLKGAVKGGIL
jgi:hypothetical protein